MRPPITARIGAWGLLALLASGCALVPPEEDPMLIKLNDVDARVGRVEAVVNNQSLLDLSRRIDALETQLRQLRGSIEETQNSGESLRVQQRNLYGDLDKRLAGMEAQLKLLASGTPAAAPATDDQAAYNRAFETLKGGDYAGAIAQWRDFISRYPNSMLLDNAQYWLGEAYYVTRDYDAAATAFRTVGEKWPNSRKAGDALLKLGYTQQEQKKLPEARATLRQVQQRFPDTEAARLAGERLARMPAEAR